MSKFDPLKVNLPLAWKNAKFADAKASKKAGRQVYTARTYAHGLIADAYAALACNKSDPHARETMLAELQAGVETPFGEKGVVPWIELQAKRDRKAKRQAARPMEGLQDLLAVA